MLTYSESLFEELVYKNGMSLKKLDSESEETSPDYLVSSGNDPFEIFEVKEMSWSKEELQRNAGPNNNEFVRVYPRERVQRLIKGSRRQLKAAQEKYPAVPRISTLFSMIGSGRLSKDILDSALFGLIGQDDEGLPSHAHKALLTRDSNTSISAVAVLSKRDESYNIDFYKNPFAATEYNAPSNSFGKVFVKSFNSSDRLDPGWQREE